MRNLTGLGLCLLVGAIGGAFACNAAPAEDGDSAQGAASAAELAGVLDVNDVSILFPAKEALSIADGSAGDSAKAVFTKNFDAIMKHAAGIGITPNGAPTKLEAWKVVSVRFDPCAPGFSEGAMKAAGAALTRAGVPAAAACFPQIRFIAQPFEGATDADFAAHLVFDLAPVISQTADVEAIKDRVAESPQVLATVKLLQAIKAASEGTTTGQPLGVHPGLRTHASAVRPLIDKLMATPKSPSSIAFMGLAGRGPEPWVFFAGRVDKTMTWQAVPSPVIAGMTPDKNGIAFAPFSSSVIAPDFPGSVTHVSPFAVEDADKAHFFNMDCVSCHISSGSFIFGKALDVGFPKNRLPKNITGYIARDNMQNDSWNVRNFGYFFGSASVSGRTLSETIDVVKFVNERIVKAPTSKSDPTPLLGPGPDCSEQDPVVWKCVRDGRTGDDQAPTAASCFVQCANGGKLPVPDAEEAPPPAPVKPLANTGEGEPCTAAEAKLDETSVTVAATTATIRGNDMMCLSRNLHGAFTTADNAVSIKCSTGACTVGLDAASVKLTGADAKFFATKVFVTAGKAFRTRGLGGAVLIDCTAGGDACTFSVSAQADGAAATGSVINPKP